MCEASWANDWTNVDSVDFFFTCGEYGFSSKRVAPILGNAFGI